MEIQVIQANDELQAYCTFFVGAPLGHKNLVRHLLNEAIVSLT